MTTVLGSGISGLTVAINLAKKGIATDVYEKNKEVGMRFQGDLQGLENWSEKKDILEELKKINIEINFDCAPFSKVTLTNCYKNKEIETKRPLFYLVKRGPLPGTIDHGLKEQALKLGVNIHFGKTIPHNKTNIVATGPNPNKLCGVVKGITFKTNFKDTAIIIFNDKLAFKGYSYLLITKNYGCMCTVVLREIHRATECFNQTKKYLKKKLTIDIQSPQPVNGFGSFSINNTFKKNSALYTGEAAGLQDFFWGFGMRHAFTSGYLAAQSIINNKNYEQNAKNHFKNKLKASVVNRYLWENILYKKDYTLFINNAELVKKNLYSIYNYSILHKTIYPTALIHMKKKYNKKYEKKATKH